MVVELFGVDVVVVIVIVVGEGDLGVGGVGVVGGFMECGVEGCYVEDVVVVGDDFV